MRALLVALSLAAAATPRHAAAQTPPAVVGERYVPAPWWMREPVIASIGYVKTEVPANRASFTATFEVVDRSGAQAMSDAGAKVRELGAALTRLGHDKARVQTTFSMQPLYEQYRDKDGNLLTNARPDKIERYSAQAHVQITVLDVAALENIYATVLSAKPSNTGPVGFTLEPTNELKSWLYIEAVKDAARRARQAVEASGARLGAVKIIDPTARACQTDVFAGWPSYGGDYRQPTSVNFRSEFGPPPPPPPPAPSARMTMLKAGQEGAEEAAPLPLQPPLETLTAQSCAVYGLG